MAAASGSGSGGSSMAIRNHPFRLEVQDITPVSASILWSLRPPPLSAIPRNLFRQSKQSAHQQRHHRATASISSSASSSSHTPKFPVNRLASEVGVTATRSVNRKVTKVTLRNISPHNKQNRLNKQSQPYPPGVESEDWPSDDGAAAVDEDEQREEDEGDDDLSRLNADDCSEASDDGTASAKIFDSGVSVCVNGVPWSQVMMGDRGADEAFMVVYGLSPSRDYELLLKVEGEENTVVSLSTTADREEKTTTTTQQGNLSTDQTRSAAQQTPILTGLRTHTPPMQDTDASTIDGPSELGGYTLGTAAAVAATTTPSSQASSTVSAAAIQASIRRARKEASRAESALRSEIEAIKRGLERMSDVDHRSKQKVLALQESIRQATLHAKDIDEEATEVEGGREEWEKKEREKEAELQNVKSVVEESLRQGDAKIKQDDDEVEVVEKELQKITKVLEDKWTARLRMERDRVNEAEQELMRVQMEIDNLLRPQHYSQGGSQYYSSPSQERNAGYLVPLQNNQMTNRGKSRAALKGGGNRSTSNPAAGASTSRRIYNKARGHGHSHTNDDSFYEYHGASSSSTHGSTLNPHNPEFIPASASPVISKSVIPDYSPNTVSRFAFYNNRDQEFNSPNQTTHLSPHMNASTIPWATTGTSSTNQTVGVPYWSNSSMNPSPTLGHDIWSALPSNPSPLASSHQSPILSSPLHTKTSIPFGLNKSPLRSPSHAAPSPSEESHHRGVPFLNFPREEETANSRRESDPVSPSLPS